MENLPAELEDKLRKIQKLLAMAKNAGSEQEASNAAARAADLMRRHNITEAELRILDPKVSAEPIERCFYVDRTEKKVAWKATIAYAVAQSYGCHQYFWGGSIVALGRRSAVQAMQYTCQFLFREVERLTDEAWKKFQAEPKRGQRVKLRRMPDGSLQNLTDAQLAQRQLRAKVDYVDEWVVTTPRQPSTKLWKGNFRLGAANAIAHRLALKTSAEKAAREEALREAKATLRRNSAGGEAAVREQLAAEKLVETLTAAHLPSSTVALAIVDRDQDEVDEAYAREKKGFRGSVRFSRRVALREAYAAGSAAGQKVHLGAAKGGLKAPPGQLKGR